MLGRNWYFERNGRWKTPYPAALSPGAIEPREAAVLNTSHSIPWCAQAEALERNIISIPEGSRLDMM
jgi:hypothetical protein